MLSGSIGGGVMPGILGLILLTGIGNPAEPVQLPGELGYDGSFAVASDGMVFFVDEEGCLMRWSLEDPASVQELEVAWGDLLDEWDGLGIAWNVSGSPDGSMICFSRFARVPDECWPDSVQSRPSPLLVVVCGTDGSDPRILGLSWDIGYPEFEFTRDNARVFSESWYVCPPTPQGWVGLVTRNPVSSGVSWSGMYASVEDGSRSGDRSYGDRIHIFDDPLRNDAPADSDTPLLYVDSESWTVQSEEEGYSENAPVYMGMVAPDAYLAKAVDGSQFVRFADGREYSNPGDPLIVYCRLPDGRHVFSRDDGETVFLGTIDWRTFQSSDAEEIPGLAGADRWCGMTPLLDGSGVVYRSGRGLSYLRLQ